MSHWGNTYWPIWISVCSFLFLVPEVISQIFNHYNSLSEYAWRELGVSKAFQFTMHSAAWYLSLTAYIMAFVILLIHIWFRAA
jgi:hypothetical protein